jgi:hypothetical protein
MISSFYMGSCFLGRAAIGRPYEKAALSMLCSGRHKNTVVPPEFPAKPPDTLPL